MNRIIIVLIIIILASIGFISWQNNKKNQSTEITPVQALDKSTKADTTNDIDTNLDKINTDTGSDVDLKSIDTDLKNI